MYTWVASAISPGIPNTQEFTEEFILLSPSILSTSKKKVVFSAFEYLYHWAGSKDSHVLSELVSVS